MTIPYPNSYAFALQPLLAAGIILFGCAPQGRAQVDFSTQVRPILAGNCAVCHGPDEPESGLNLLDKDSALAQSDSGAYAIVAGDVNASEVWARVTSTDEDIRMPPEGKGLNSNQLATIRAWIEQGADWSTHWSHHAVERPQPPEVVNSDWIGNAIDNFVLSRLESAGIDVAPRADEIALLRRVTYDLTGLPPSPEEVQAYAAEVVVDPASAYERLIERLLASPHYGERWGRHWLDLVRYGESDGYERDNLKPKVWKYRDYVIRSFNEDMPYNQFIREQLSGDELLHPTADQITATGYYRLGLWDDEPVDALQAYYDHLDDVVTTTSEAFLGMTLHCARCHDHKIDPLSQRDYYSFMAFFHNILQNVRQGQFEDFAFTLNTVVDVSAEQDRIEHQNQVDEKKAALAQLNAQIKELSDQIVGTFSNAEQEDAADPATRRRMVKNRYRRVLDESGQRLWETLNARRREVNERKIPGLDAVLAVRENGSQAPTTYVLQRGNAHALGEEVMPAFPEILNFSVPPIPAQSPHPNSCGRRSVLANWIASAHNPLTSRVVVNRVWQHLFGRGIVESSSDFGFQGTPPTHPRLLDWLAAEFVERGWRFKSLHRLVLTSNTYRMSARASDTALEKDADNRLFSRQNMRRLSAEEIRDSMLAVSGQLNPEMFGPSVAIELAPEVLQSQSRPGKDWEFSPMDQQRRRSIYVRVKRSLLVPLLDTFDLAEPDVSCPVRFSTTQPTQALALLNSKFATDQARFLAARLEKEAGGNDAAQVERALWLIMQRAPTESEITRGVRLMTDLREAAGSDRNAAVHAPTPLQTFCLMSMNLNEFLFLD